MRTLSLLLVALGSITLATAWAFDDIPILVYACPRIQTAPTIDGRLDDPCWQAAPAVDGFTYFKTNQLTAVQTFFRVTYDEAGVYFAVTCEEPAMEKFSQISAPRDSHDIFGQESIEIFLDPGHTHGSFYQLAINTAGALSDGKYPAEGTQWNGNIAVATTTGEDAWHMEVAIPWQDIDVDPQPGQVHGFNVCRDRYVAGRERSSWSGGIIGGYYPDHGAGQLHAHLVLSPTAEQLGALGAEFRKGARTGPIQMSTAEGFGDQPYRFLLQATVDKLQAQLAALRRLAEHESETTSKELQRRAHDGEAEADKAREALAEELVDAQTYMHLDARLNELVVGLSLGQTIWEARLQVLLSDI